MNTLNFIVPRCADTCVPGGCRVPGSGSSPTPLDAPLVLAPIVTDPKPRDAWDDEVGVKTRRHLAGEGGPTWASGLAGRCAQGTPASVAFWKPGHLDLEAAQNFGKRQYLLVRFYYAVKKTQRDS